MIEREPLGGATLLRFAHGKANALDLEFLREIQRTLIALEPEGRPLVLTGTGSIFGAGVDLKRLTDGGASYVREFMPALSDAFLTLFRFPRPVVAAVNGHAIAGGAVIAFACDRRILARGKAKFGVPELKVGVPFPTVPLEIVRDALSQPALQEATLHAALWDADQALAAGAVDELVEPGALLVRAREVAEQLGAISPTAYRLTKLQLRGPALDRIAKHRDEWDAAVNRAWETEEVLGAVRAYVERTLKV